MITWDKQNEDFIRNNWTVLTDQEIADKLGTSKGVIITKRRRLGLKRKAKIMKNTGPINYDAVLSDFKSRDYTLISDSIKTRVQKIQYFCNKHRDKGVQEINLSGFYRGRGCYYCGRERTIASRALSDQNLKERCEALDFTYVGKYRRGDVLCVRYICNKHKEHGIQIKLAGNLNKATNCPYCKVSHGEAEVSSYLNRHGYAFVREKRFPDCRDKYTLPFDFYVPDINTAIEYDGEGHYMTVPYGCTAITVKDHEEELQNRLHGIKVHDEIKNKYCKQKNIRLIRVPYWENDIEAYLNKALA